MKKASLEHYRRKKFCCRLFMRDSPRSGAIMGIGILALIFLLKPFAVWGGLYYALSEDSSPWPFLAAYAILTIAAWALAILFVCGGRRKRHGKFRDMLTAEFWKRQWHWAFAVFALVLLIISGGIWLIQLAALALLLLASVCEPEKRRRGLKKAAFLPALLAAAVIVVTHLLVVRQELILSSGLEELADLSGMEIDHDRLSKIESAGFSMEREPLRAMLANCPADANCRYSPNDPPAAAAEKLANYRKRNLEFTAALESFSRLEVRYIGHRLKGGIVDTKLCCREFREGAGYYALLIQTAGGDRDAIRAANGKIERLRDWMLNSRFELENLTGASIENIRIEALAGTLTCANWSRAEFRELLGNPPAWDRVFIRSRAVEMIEFGEWISPFITGHFGGDPEKNIPPRLLPDAGRLYFYSDWSNKLSAAVNSIRLLSADDLAGKPEELRIRAMSPASKGYIFSSLAGDTGTLWRMYVRAMDRRLMAEIACEVMQKLRIDGRLPTDLGFLSIPHRSILDHREIELDTGMMPDHSGSEFYGLRLHISGRGNRNDDLTIRLTDAPEQLPSPPVRR